VRLGSLHQLRMLGRWACISSSISAFLFLTAGTTRISSLRAYLVVFSSMLLITMLAVDPRLARERANPGDEAISTHLRVLAGFLFLLTLGTAASFVGRTHVLLVPAPYRWVALAILVLSSSLQAWAMTSNPFFSPVVRIQSERKHTLIDSGPYRFVRHPGYLAMGISAVASAIAIGSCVASVPAIAFLLVIRRRAQVEDCFLRSNLEGYAQHAQRVPSGLPLTWGC
jgi:protein-S-isoprenylcysteine O-methyltransferase Ste14